MNPLDRHPVVFQTEIIYLNVKSRRYILVHSVDVVKLKGRVLKKKKNHNKQTKSNLYPHVNMHAQNTLLGKLHPEGDPCTRWLPSRLAAFLLGRLQKFICTSTDLSLK